jgi:hypothetical protein
MDDEAVYGKRFHLLTFKDAIRQKIISDFKVVTMAITRADIEELIAHNALLNVNLNGLDEVEALRLASGIALRRMYQNYGVRYAISFHRSIRAAEQFRAQQDVLNHAEAGVRVVNLHVSSYMTAPERKAALRDVTQHEHALITNARCLTEGIDIPAIDCVLFAAPKRSAVDIVQAAGRAMRTAPGKVCGYILLPLVVPSGVSFAEFAETTAFKEIARIITALASQDERIVEQFRLIDAGSVAADAVIHIDGSISVGMPTEFGTFADAVQTKIWEQVGRYYWRPFAEAREFVRRLGLRSSADWHAYRRSDQCPSDIPASPNAIYAQRGWVGMGDWLGTGTIATRLREYLPFGEARAFVSSLGLKSQAEWDAFARSARFPADLPRAPHMVYADDGWESWGDWLGTGRIATYKVEYRAFGQARSFARALRLKSRTEWLEFARSGQLPQDIPIKPERTYAKKGWRGMGDWLGTGTIQPGRQQYRPFLEARAFTRALKFKSAKEWRVYCKSKKRPADIPTNPNLIYKEDGWSSWADWLGTQTIATNQRQYRSFEMARSFVHSLGLKSANEWRAYTKSGQLPPDIPVVANMTYQHKGWISWSDWLGTDNKARGRRGRSGRRRGPSAPLNPVHENRAGEDSG